MEAMFGFKLASPPPATTASTAEKPATVPIVAAPQPSVQESKPLVLESTLRPAATDDYMFEWAFYGFYTFYVSSSARFGLC